MSKIHRKLKNVKHGGGEKRKTCFLTSMIAATGMLAILISVFAYLMNKGYVSVAKASLCGKVCLAAASMLGCYLAARRAQRRRLLYSAAVGAAIFVLSLAGSAAIIGTRGARLWLPAAICAGSALISAVLGAGSKRSSYR